MFDNFKVEQRLLGPAYFAQLWVILPSKKKKNVVKLVFTYN